MAPPDALECSAGFQRREARGRAVRTTRSSAPSPACRRVRTKLLDRLRRHRRPARRRRRPRSSSAPPVERTRRDTRDAAAARRHVSGSPDPGAAASAAARRSASRPTRTSTPTSEAAARLLRSDSSWIARRPRDLRRALAVRPGHEREPVRVRAAARGRGPPRADPSRPPSPLAHADGDARRSIWQGRATTRRVRSSPMRSTPTTISASSPTGSRRPPRRRPRP